MREIITLQIGQCGNQIGSSFWQRLSSLHPKSQPSQFFYLADDNMPVPRAILLDLEPRVISQITSTGLFNHENIFVSNEGGGAGNNWASGYLCARSRKNEIFEMIHRESENSDMLESFFILHSIAGGTGSGMGSYLIEELRDEFPKKMLQSFSVFPNNEEVSDVVVQPYNSVLTLKRLNRCCDSVVVMDNAALGRISSESLRIKQPSYETINSLISTVICASTCTLRTPTYMYSDLRSIVSTLIPVNGLNFIVPSYTPFINKDCAQIIRKTTVNDVLRRLMMSKNKLAGIDTRAIISALTFFINTNEIGEVQRSIIRMQDKQLVGFVPWMPPSFHAVVCQEDNAAEQQVSGLSLTNSTGVSALLRKICEQYDKLKKRNAFTEIYRKYLDGLEEFDASREVVEQLIAEYERCELTSFCER
ncbi:Gamma tubulin [Trachipleistophora hominis]|uniref:Tubulin gamma chain n=1 Tax=Trachipleistophora hominis TaxID=72359 RepID=L7JXT7_TRAHO|nr:Gamma tubulin [Trachipleistophora hominis]